MSTFDSVWSYFQSNLTPGKDINNWTAKRGFLGDKMTVIKVTEKSLSIDSPNAKSIQVVPVRDFKSVYSVWSDYIANKLLRSELTELTRYSKYVISILHWYDDITKKTSRV